MFLKGEDLYFLSYNTLVLLHGLGCLNSGRPFLDCSKIAFLIDFVANTRLARIMGSMNKKDIRVQPPLVHHLQSAYTDGLVRRHIVSRLIFALEKRKVLSVEIAKGTGLVNSWLESEIFSSDFFNTDLYEVEFENLALIRKALPHLRTMTSGTMLQRMFGDNGVTIWDV